jgi:hypothetical protein
MLRTLPLALVLAACATQSRPAPSPAEAAAAAEPCAGRCVVLVDNPSQRPLDVYYNGVDETAPQLLGTVNPRETTHMVVPIENAGWVLLTARQGPNGIVLDHRRVRLSVGHEAEFRINVQRIN